jgi:hypothetical protein
LKPYNHREGEPEALPGPILLDDAEAPEDRYEVETVLSKRKYRQKIRYLVKWKGWPAEYNEWVPEEDMDESLVQEFQARN